MSALSNAKFSDMRFDLREGMGPGVILTAGPGVSTTVPAAVRVAVLGVGVLGACHVPNRVQGWPPGYCSTFQLLAAIH